VLGANAHRAACERAPCRAGSQHGATCWSVACSVRSTIVLSANAHRAACERAPCLGSSQHRAAEVPGHCVPSVPGTVGRKLRAPASTPSVHPWAQCGGGTSTVLWKSEYRAEANAHRAREFRHRAAEVPGTVLREFPARCGVSCEHPPALVSSTASVRPWAPCLGSSQHRAAEVPWHCPASVGSTLPRQFRAPPCCGRSVK
jgi:hypothetical protein